MRVEIEGEAAAFVEHLVRSGRFGSAREALEDAVRLSERREQQLQALRAEIAVAEAEGDDGTLEDLDRELEAVFRGLEKDVP